MEEEKSKKKVKIPTAKKRESQNEKRRLKNKSFKSKIKTAIRTFKSVLKSEDPSLKQEKLNVIFSLVDKGTKKKIFKKNKTNRIKSKMSSLLLKKS